MSPPTPHSEIRQVRQVLVLVDDAALAELLDEALREAGHLPTLLQDAAGLAELLASRRFDAAIVDLETRARDGLQLLERLRDLAAGTTLIALTPCGGFAEPVRSHFVIEKPARLAAIFSAVAASRARSQA